MYGNPYNPQQMTIDRLKRNRDELDNLIKNYQQIPQQQPVNNIINANQPQTPQNNLVEWRILNENEQVDNLYVNNKTLFINDNMMVLKGVDGSLEKWEVKKIYPIDKKDEKITELENKLKEMEEKLNEYAERDKPTNGKFKSNADDDVATKSTGKTSTK